MVLRRCWHSKTQQLLGSLLERGRASFIHACRCVLQACILFGLGLVVITIQLAVRLGCSKLASLNIDSITVSDVCLTIPAISSELCTATISCCSHLLLALHV